MNKLRTTTTKKISSYVHTCTYKHAHTSDFHLLPRYMARQVKYTPKSTSPEPPQVHTITFHSVTLPSHSVTFLNNYLSLHRHTKSSDDDYLGSGARKYHRPVVVCELKPFIVILNVNKQRPIADLLKYPV